MLKELVKVANRLDSLGLTKEADALDRWINKMAAGFSEQRNKEIGDFLAKTLPSLFESVAGSVEDRAGKILSYPLDNENPLYMVIAGLVKSTNRVNLSYDQVRLEIIKGFEFNKKKDTTLSRDPSSLYNVMTLKNGTNPPGYGAGLIFDEVIVKSVWAQIQRNKKSLEGPRVPPDEAQALVEEVVYPKPTAPGKPPTKSPTKSSPSAPKRDWAYYLSKQNDEYGKNMERFWFITAPKLGMETDYTSFVRYYKSLGRNVDSKTFIGDLFGRVMTESNDDIINGIYESKVYTMDPSIVIDLYKYMGFNTSTKSPSSVAEISNSKKRLEKILKTIRNTNYMAESADSTTADGQAKDFRATRIKEKYEGNYT